MLITDAREAISDEAPLERVRTLTGELQQIARGLMARGAGPDGRPAGPQEQRPRDEDVVDAEFTPS
jgi:molecular chaperone DnaK